MTDDINIVMPVQNGANYLDECLEYLTAEISPASITIVDDASTDGSSEIARRHKVAVIGHSSSLGPYSARNTGWKASKSQIVVFTDVRCRARIGWLAALQDALTRPGVAIAGCDIQMVATSPTTAQRWAIRHQPLGVSGYLEHPFLPFVPTACLAIRRIHLGALGGFQDIRSGADADLCWRAQRSGLGEVAIGEVSMWARPRTRTADVITQFKRYGSSGWDLQRKYGYRGDPPEPPQLLGSAWRALTAVWSGRRDPAVALLDARRIVAYEQEFRVESRRYARKSIR